MSWLIQFSINCQLFHPQSVCLFKHSQFVVEGYCQTGEFELRVVVFVFEVDMVNEAQACQRRVVEGAF